MTSKLRCGVCFTPIDTADQPHACSPIPLSTARVDAVTWHYLTEPDEEDLKFATYETIGGKRLLEPCPFCGAKPGPPTTRVRVDNGMFQTIVACHAVGCNAELYYNGYSKKEAHVGAVTRWNDRRPWRNRREEFERKHCV